MKKTLMTLLVVSISLMLITSFSLIGCKTEGTSTEEETTEETAEEEEVAEEEEEVEEPSLLDEITVTEEIEKWAEYTALEPDTRGPEGEIPIWYSEILNLTEEEIMQVREGALKVAWIAQNMHPAEEARIRGAEQAMEELNMELISVTDCELDPAKQMANVETVMALNPDAITSLAVDPVQAVEAFRPAVEAGVILSFMSGVPQGYTMGVEYAGMVTVDAYGSGQRCAEMLSEAIRAEGKEGKLGYIYHGVTFWNTNEWDRGFKETIEKMDDMEIITEGGFITAEDIENQTSAMITQYPEINGIYTSFYGENAVASIKAANRPDIKVVCNELSEIAAMDMASDGNFIGSAMTIDYLLGYTRVYLIAWGLLGKVPDSFAITPVIGVTKENLEEHWYESYRQPLPEEILEKLEE